MSDIAWMVVNFLLGMVVGAIVWRWGYRTGQRDGHAMRRKDVEAE